MNRPNLLYLTHRVPYPPDKGDRIRTLQILRYLSQKADVHLASLADEPTDPQAWPVLSAYCKQVAVVPLGRLRWARTMLSLARGRTATEGAFRSPEMRSIVRRWASETPFAVALASSSSMVPYLRLPELAAVPAVVDLIDVDSQKWFDYAATGRGPKAWLYRLEAKRLRRLEQDLPTWTRGLTLVSPAEVAIFRNFCPDGNVHAVGNGVDLDYFQPRPEGAQPHASQNCVFLGALDYWPNVDGLCWFSQEVWPRLHRRHPQATFSIVGRRPVAAIERLAAIPGVQLVGQVPDVRPYLANASVSVVPLRIARGIQNKVLESLAMGKATIVSPQALEGIEAQPGQHLLEAVSAEEWVGKISDLLTQPDLRRRLGAAGRAFTETHHRWETCLKPLDRLLGLTSEHQPDPMPLVMQAAG